MVKPKTELKKITFIVKGKECVITKPDFKQITFGLTALSNAEGKRINLVGGGKAIYDVCMIECDKAIKEDAVLLMSVCLKISEEFLIPIEVEIKKN